ncbi:hypothetical protein JH06_1061 [Blastocystis sp. subtype 4]|uniref:hypothetical protein n=1 Tax=Blastocystis sp. subtype 4 TaxID=944170 RepID=UPI000711C4D4|nr:hypothetical protein JH06_1061 [Blastocystis sp. subtype 4]KNB45262.1 hypothetical protein JH06_1061 [Blastocystis sp. subtype 4]|eukprot:XP_014528705.1 hypothetical protein JH06_1061 [Blastocystis sp. subtype 4]
MEPELISLYSSHHKHEMAISQILTPLRDPNLPSADRKQRLQDLMHYLQQLGSDYQNLIFDCSRMFYKESRQLVLELFVGYAPTDGGEAISNQAIMEHLKELSENDTQLENEWEKNALEITFLRNLIWEKKETGSMYHTELVFLYTSSISSLEKSLNQLETKKQEVETERERNAEFASAEDGLALLISQRRELLLRSKKELLEFLELSDCYDATDILQKLDTNEFLEERAIILSKLGEYLNALEIIAHQMGNVDMAEAYCQKIFVSGKNPNIFLHLIKTYLFPPPTSTLSNEESIQLALRVFGNHVDKLDPVEVIGLLPDSISLESVLMMIDSLEILLTRLDEKQRTVLMIRKLAELRRIDVGHEYQNMRNMSFENTTTTTCPVCKRLIGDSVFIWNPNGVVIHAACAKTTFSLVS